MWVSSGSNTMTKKFVEICTVPHVGGAVSVVFLVESLSDLCEMARVVDSTLGLCIMQEPLHSMVCHEILPPHLREDEECQIFCWNHNHHVCWLGPDGMMTAI